MNLSTNQGNVCHFCITEETAFFSYFFANEEHQGENNFQYFKTLIPNFYAIFNT